MNLLELREKILQLPRDEVARHARIEEHRLQEIEADEETITLSELEGLAMVYGINADLLAENNISNALSPVLLARENGYKDFLSSEKLAILRASRTIDDLTQLIKIVRGDVAMAKESSVVEWRWNKSSIKAWEQGRDIAKLLRNELSLGNKPIDSSQLYREIAQKFPWLSVLYADLGEGGPSGLAFSRNRQQPTIVLNVKGKNKSPAVLRVSFLHELYHILMDKQKGQPLAAFSKYNELREEMEQRANSFAIRFICPELVVRRMKNSRNGIQNNAILIMNEYGLPYEAVRLYFKNLQIGALPQSIPEEIKEYCSQDRWSPCLPERIGNFPIPDTPYERRTSLADLAVRAYKDNKIQRDKLAYFLGVAPAADLEACVDFVLSQETR